MLAIVALAACVVAAAAQSAITSTTSFTGVSTLTGHSAGVWSVAVDFERQLAISGSDDHTVKVWNVSSGLTISTLSGHSEEVNAVAVDFGRQRALSGSWDNTLKLWNLTDLTPIRTLYHRADVNAIVADFERQLAISASSDNTLKMWNLSDDSAGTAIGELYNRTGFNSAVTAVAADFEARLAISGGRDCKLRIWNLTECARTCKQIAVFKGHNSTVRSIVLDVKRQLALSGSDDRTLKLWNFTNLHNITLIRTFSGHTDPVCAVAWDSRRQIAISGGDDRTLRVWSLTSGVEMRTLFGHAGPVLSIAANFEREMVISGSADGTLKVWNIPLSAARFYRLPPLKTCPLGDYITNLSACRKAAAAYDLVAQQSMNTSRPLGCSSSAQDVVFNQGSSVDTSEGASWPLCLSGPYNISDGLCTCPRGHAGHNCTRDGEYRCVIKPASSEEWAASLGCACLAALGMLGMSKFGGSARSSSPAIGLESSRVEEETGLMKASDSEEMFRDGAKLAVLQALLEARGDEWWLVVMAHNLGRCNMQIVLPSVLAWVCPWIMTFTFMGRELHLLLVLVIWLLLSGICSPVGARLQSGRASFMDLVLPGSPSIIGFWKVETNSSARSLMAAEVLRSFTLAFLTFLSLTPNLPTLAWPQGLPNTPACQQFFILHAAGLDKGVQAMAVFGLAANVLAACFCIWVSILLADTYSQKPSSEAAYLRGEVAPEAQDMDGWVEELLAKTSGADWDAQSVQSGCITLERNGQILKVRLIQKSKFYIITVLPLFADIGTDMNATRIYMLGGNWAFGTLNSTLFAYTAMKDFRRWVKVFRSGGELQLSLRRGFQSRNLLHLRRGEVEDESVLSCALNIYGLPFAVRDESTFFQQLCGIVLSMKAIATRLLERDMGL